MIVASKTAKPRACYVARSIAYRSLSSLASSGFFSRKSSSCAAVCAICAFVVWPYALALCLVRAVCDLVVKPHAHVLLLPNAILLNLKGRIHGLAM